MSVPVLIKGLLSSRVGQCSGRNQDTDGESLCPHSRLHDLSVAMIIVTPAVDQ